MRIDLLDNGYIELIESWGSDERIVESARMSTNKGFQGWGTKDTPGDEKLLCYLWEHKHATPFEMAGATFEVQAPLIVFREWHRHRTQSYNELSARYTPMPDRNYLPSMDRLMQNASGSNKQAGTVPDAAQLTGDAAARWLEGLCQHYLDAETLYQEGLKAGVPKELARLVIPVGRYSRMRASANLRNWLGFLTLRLDPHAQYEIRVYAQALSGLLRDKFPRTMQLFEETSK
jgi:thymidylate synthase (FAD)